MPPIVFYFPYPRVGGVSVLFLRLAKKLVGTADIYLMDLSDGYMATNLPPGCQFIPFDKPELIPANSIVVFQSVPPWRIRDLESFPLGAKVLFWNLHPYNLSPGLIHKGSRFLSVKLVRTLNKLFSVPRLDHLKQLCVLLESKNSIVFMDEENRSKTSVELEMPLSPVFLPITTEDAPKFNEVIRIERPLQKLKVAWVGRIEGFKIPILLHTLVRFNDIASFDIEFDIVGDGIEIDFLIEKVASLKRLKVNFKGNVNYKQLDQMLCQQHMVFAMGTSALDSAKLGIPTFVLDYSYSDIVGNYRYRLLRTATGYNVAEEITTSHMEATSSLDSMLQDLVDNYEIECKLAYDYWRNNHSPGVVSDMFLVQVGKATATIGDIVDARLHVPDFMTNLISLVDRRKPDGSGFIRR